MILCEDEKRMRLDMQMSYQYFAIHRRRRDFAQALNEED